MPGLEHLPYAEVWLRAADESAWREASRWPREHRQGRPRGVDDRRDARGGGVPRGARLRDRAPLCRLGARRRGRAGSRASRRAADDVRSCGPTSAAALRDRLRVVSRPAGPGGEPHVAVRGLALVGARPAPGGRVLHRARRRPCAGLRVPRGRRRPGIPRLHGDRPRVAWPGPRRGDQARADRLGEGERPRDAAHRERGASAPDAGAERAPRLPAAATPSSCCAGRRPREYPQRDSNPRCRRERPAS